MPIKLFKLEDYNTFLSGNNTITTTMPVQTLPKSKKKKPWIKATVDFLYQDAVKQIYKNQVFADIQDMVDGTFTYRAVDIERTLNDTPLEGNYKVLKRDVPIATHLKHFDFIGIIVNAIKSVFGDLDDLYRVESNDEYAINEMLRAKSSKLHQYATAIIEAEVNRNLIAMGLDPEKQDFKSQEEQQQYQATLDEAVKKLTPPEIEKELSSNFKVIAVEWANNVMSEDKKKFDLTMEDKRALTDFLLTGRWFRHYKVGYDYYSVEYWSPRDVFFSQDVDIRFPQDSDYIGRLINMSSNKVLENYGHLMTTKEQERVGNWWKQEEDYKNNSSGVFGTGLPFAEAHITPFPNYYDHQVNSQMEQALGVPLAQSMDATTGEVTRHWMPQQGFNFSSYGRGTNDKNKRKDIDVRTDTIKTMEVYWKSMKMVSFLVFRDEVGAIKLQTVTDEILPEFLKENEIKIKKSISLRDLQIAIREGRLEDYEDTITYHYTPEWWHTVVLKGSIGSVLEEDIILDARPCDFQIPGDSNYYQVKPPVAGSIGVGIAPKIFPYQQLHNICLNQVTELLADEPGTFYSIDINSLPTEYKEDQTTEETLLSIGNTIRTTKYLPLDPSRTNMEGSSVYPNIFQRNEVVFRDQVIYRRDMAEYFKQQAYSQIGITPQLLGAPNNQETAEGVKQQATSTYALISNIIDEFNSSKAKANELHISIAQQCEVNGISTNRLTQKSDASNHFIDILAEDPEHFPFRKLSVYPAANSSDRSIVKSIQQLLINDNTVQKDFSDIVDIFTNPYTLELREIGRQMKLKKEKEVQDQRAFEGQQLDKQIASADKKLADDRKQQIDLENLKGQWRMKESYINALGRDSSSTKTNEFDELTKAYEITMKESLNNSTLALKERELGRKEKLDEGSKKIELEKIQQKNKELALRQQKMSNDYAIAVTNKN